MKIIEQVTKGGQAPTYYIDNLQVEETSGSETYTIRPTQGTKGFFTELTFTIIDALDTALVNASMPNLAYDQLLGVAKLTNGIVIRAINNSPTSVSNNHGVRSFILVKVGV